MRILGVGLSKTGTVSLHQALQKLGYKSLHYDQVRLNDVLDGSNPNPDFRRYDDVDAVVDIPASYFYRELIEAYPDCKCILTVRNEHDWWKSMSFHSNERYPIGASQEDDFRFRLRNYVYGSTTAYEFLYRKKFREHNERVMREISSERLLVLDIVGRDGWEPLCKFLGHEIPSLPFPHENRRPGDRVEGVESVWYEIAELVAPGTLFILVDQMALEGEVRAGSTALPFLERDGQYWGLPPDDDTAIREVKRLRRAGASLMIFAWPAFWWLEHYAELHRYLRSEFRCIVENERLIAFDLRT